MTSEGSVKPKTVYCEVCHLPYSSASYDECPRCALGATESRKKRPSRADVIAAGTCPHCYGEVDPRATVCPHCRKKLKTGTSFELGSLLIALGLIALAGALFVDPLSCGATGIIFLIIGFVLRNV